MLSAKSLKCVVCWGCQLVKSIYSYFPDFERGLPTYFDVTVRNSLQPTFLSILPLVLEQQQKQEKPTKIKDTTARYQVQEVYSILLL